MLKEKIAYWVATIPLCGLMLMSAVMYFSHNPQVAEGTKAIGFPYFFVLFLGAAKVLGVVALLNPRFKTVTEWAYAGFTFTLLGAAWTHYSTGTSFVKPLVVLAFLAVSYRFQGVRHSG